MDADVIVLGAGMAGLSAASLLRRAGLDVLVVDARGRVGGRVHTLHDARTPVPVELGPELVHEGADAVHRLVRELSFALHELDGPTWVRSRGALAEMPGFDDSVKTGLRAAFDRLPAHGDLSMDEALRKSRLSPRVEELTRMFVQGFHAGDATKLGARALAKGGPEGRGRALRVHVGYGAVAEGLAQRAAGCLRLGTTVTRVAWQRGEVTIDAHGPTGHAVTLRARAAVIALPLGVVRAPEGEPGAVAFDPPLDDKRAALARLDMGHVVKLTLRFREAFWTDPKRVHTASTDAKKTKEKLRKSAFFFDPRGAFPTFWTSRPLAAPVLVAWAGGPAADALQGQREAQMVARALDGLARILGVPAKVAHDSLETWFTHDWGRDPLARGAYSYALVGGATAARQAGAPLSGTLFFAGEHVAPSPNNGTVHGALESGERAASEVLEALPAVRRRELAQRIARGKR
jgi:monoamine oxidase